MACDESVVRRTRAPRAYAACLTSLAERGLQRVSTAAPRLSHLDAWQRRPELVHRVHSILCGNRHCTRWRLALLSLWSAVACCFRSVELARCPQTVAFVTASHNAPVCNCAKSNAGCVCASYAAPGFRAIPAKAILPANALASAPIGDAPAYHASAPASRPAVNWPCAKPLTSLPSTRSTHPLPSVSAAPGEDQPQCIVLTTWEEVETASQGPENRRLRNRRRQRGRTPQQPSARPRDRDHTI